MLMLDQRLVPVEAPVEPVPEVPEPASPTDPLSEQALASEQQAIEGALQEPLDANAVEPKEAAVPTALQDNRKSLYYRWR